jgi:iron complex outermembrane recepter protein
MGKSRLWTALWAAGAFGCVTALVPLQRAAAAEATDAETAQDGAASADTQELEAISVVGSRRYGRSSEVETPVAVDIIPMEKIAEQGAQFDLAQSLQYIAPSFNSTRQTGADNADLVDSAMLRGLGSDQTLVLLNGKRQHQASIVNIFGARNRGNTGTDFNTIPVLAIERVEVLRDGAAAQYGSDAIAGVINIALKKTPGCESVLGYGQYSRGDGQNTLASAYCGFELNNGGVIALTGEWLKRGRSDRSIGPRTIGDTKMDNRTLFLNGEIPLGDVAHLYFSGGYQDRYASSGAFARGGIGSDDIPSRNSAAMYPNGFVPFINGDIEDRTLIVGVWGNIGGWRADVSQTYGYNELLNNISNTINASIANDDLLTGGLGLSPSKFDAGGYAFTQYTTNVDFSRYLDSVLAGTNVAFGLERRRENYEIFAGEPGSWDDFDGPGGGNGGSQGYPGFQPADETDSDRTSWAAYADFEFNWTDRFMTGVAARFEDYNDFGKTTTGKLTSSFKATDSFLLRGSASTGFRAPSLQQRDFQSTYTEFVGGDPLDILLARNNSVFATTAGIEPLREEEATSFTLGFAWSPTDNMTVTLDGYRIDIDDRVVLSGQFGVDSSAITEDLRDLLIERGVGAAAFFVNAVDTRTTGIDLTISHNAELGDGELNTYFALNHGKTEITQVNVPGPLSGEGGPDTFLSDRERRFIEDGAPSTKATLAFDYSIGKWDAMFKLIHFGSQTLGSFSGPPIFLNYGPKTSADASVSYGFTDNVKLTLGAANIFDQFPDKQNADETDNGHIYDSVQFGLNGTSYFARLSMKF